MPSLSEQKKSRSKRKETKATAAENAATAAREAALADRKLDREIDRSIAWMIGTTIRDLHRSGKLTPQQCAALGDMLELREGDKPINWDLLAPYLHPPSSSARPAPVAKPDELAAAE